ncbi:MAG: hypothetical protein LBO74_11315 [Candidatus Symbiothrix sp.]|jgi:hypothetical protein|nr:hypothetical protein [Candidatus Symbiothrix sp.]
MKKMIFLALTLIILSAASVNAQVRIGGIDTDVPTQGAVLDLNNVDDGYVGGLLLPKVSSLTLNSVEAFSTESDAATKLVGLIVYNTATSAEGIYIWTGPVAGETGGWKPIWKKI